MSPSKPSRNANGGASGSDASVAPAARTESASARQRAADARRKRQFVAVGSVIASLIFALAIVLISQPGAGSSSNAERRTIGNPNAPVLITEWSDFQ